MAYFYSLRGWLEVDPDKYKDVLEQIENIRENNCNNQHSKLYIEGWCWSKTIINWTGYIFYGADVKKDGIPLFVETLEQLISLKIGLSGFFHAQGEDRVHNQTFTLNNDVLTIEDSFALIDEQE